MFRLLKQCNGVWEEEGKLDFLSGGSTVQKSLNTGESCVVINSDYCLSGDSQEDANGASSSSFFVLFSFAVDSIQALSIISFPRFKWFLMPVHLSITHLLLFICSRVLKISQKSLSNPILTPRRVEL